MWKKRESSLGDLFETKDRSEVQLFCLWCYQQFTVINVQSFLASEGSNDFFQDL